MKAGLTVLAFVIPTTIFKKVKSISKIGFNEDSLKPDLKNQDTSYYRNKMWKKFAVKQEYSHHVQKQRRYGNVF